MNEREIPSLLNICLRKIKYSHKLLFHNDLYDKWVEFKNSNLNHSVKVTTGRIKCLLDHNSENFNPFIEFEKQITFLKNKNKVGMMDVGHLNLSCCMILTSSVNEYCLLSAKYLLLYYDNNKRKKCVYLCESCKDSVYIKNLVSMHNAICPVSNIITFYDI